MGLREDGSIDWRKLPRYDKEYRSRTIIIRVTPTEFRVIHELAELTGKKISDYVACRALGVLARGKVAQQKEES